MNYAESVAYIESLAPTILNPSLERFALFMNEHQRLQDKLVTIHIAGTNGKGSTVAIVDSVLRTAGLAVGRFTGPHLLRWNERFHVNGQPIDDETLAAYAGKLRAMSEQFGAQHPQLGALTWFEYLTAIAFFYFTDRQVDVAVIEVGLGGRWDATNVLARPIVSAITTIDLDHTHILGETVTEIAREKAGIIKSGVPVVTACSGQALRQIEQRAAELAAPVYACTPPNMVSGPEALDVQFLQTAAVELSLPGVHQRVNALVAAAVLQLADKHLHKNLAAHAAEGFARVYWPGRLQYIPETSLIMDGAHNVAGAQALRASLDYLFASQKRVFVLSFFQNKNVEGAIAALVRPGDLVFAAEAKSSRALYAAEEIVAQCEKRGARAIACKSIGVALRRALEEQHLTVATGSFATIKESMKELGWQTVEDGADKTWRSGGWDGTQRACS